MQTMKEQKTLDARNNKGLGRVSDDDGQQVLARGICFVLYLTLDCDSNVAAAQGMLAQLAPTDRACVTVGKTALPPAAAVEWALAMMLTACVARGALVGQAPAAPKAPAKAAKLVAALFGDLTPFQPLALSERGVGAAMQRWLEVVQLLKAKVDVQLRLQETELAAPLASGDVVNAEYDLHL
jgi:hypothetical protein